MKTRKKLKREMKRFNKLKNDHLQMQARKRDKDELSSTESLNLAEDYNKLVNNGYWY